LFTLLLKGGRRDKKLKIIVLGFLVKTRQRLRHNRELIQKKEGRKGNWSIVPEKKRSI